MEAKFYIESGQPKVLINDEWNSLSLFLETDSSFKDARTHIELKKQGQWMGNASVIKLLSGNNFEISTPLDLNLAKVSIYQKQLLKLIDAWNKFNNDKKVCSINV